jgi:hypothetical protein
VIDDLPQTPLPSREKRFAGATRIHPRLWLTSKRLSGIRKSVHADKDDCTWQHFFEKSVLPWMDREITAEPAAIPVNGNGQYAGKDKSQAMQVKGSVVSAERRDDHIFSRGDATQAYCSLSPEVTSAVRDVHFVNDTCFVIVDSIDATAPVSIDWLLHANAPMRLGGTTFRSSGERAGFYGRFLWSEAGAPCLAQETGFADVDSSEFDGSPVSTCLKASFPKATRHRIATIVMPYPLAAPRRGVSFLDDQGYDCDLYFTDAQDRTFKVVVPKTSDFGTTSGT